MSFFFDKNFSKAASSVFKFVESVAQQKVYTQVAALRLKNVPLQVGNTGWYQTEIYK